MHTFVLGTARDSMRQNILIKERGCIVIDENSNYTALGREIGNLKRENEELKEKVGSLQMLYKKALEREKAHLAEIEFQRRVIDHLISQ